MRDYFCEKNEFRFMMGSSGREKSKPVGLKIFGRLENGKNRQNVDDGWGITVTRDKEDAFIFGYDAGG